MKKVFIGLVCLFLGGAGMKAQVMSDVQNKEQTEKASFRDNWYVQAGMDMMLQNPHGYNIKDVFPNGNSLGIEAAVGKWFTPGVGVRFKLEANNMFGGPLKNDHHIWAGPWGEPGANNDGGGLVAGYGDVQFNVFHYVHGYNPDRKWSLLFYPRMGFIVNRAINTGSPILGFGMQNTYRIDRRWSVYVDAAYHMMSSGIGMDPSVSTGLGSSSNGFFDISVGAQFDLDTRDMDERHPKTARKPALLDGWFLQAGLDMNLQNPYGKDFSEVFPKGKSFGLHAAIGKNLSPELYLRAKLQWTNGLLKNGHAEWLAPFGRNNENYDKGGMVAMYAEPHLMLSNVILGIDSDRCWNIAGYPRMGLIYNFAMEDVSPVIGVGVINYYRLNPKWSLYFDVAYNMSTTEYTGTMETWSGGGKNGNANGYFDLNLGVQYDI